MASQLSTEEKIAYANKNKVKYYLLENKGSILELYTNIDKYLDTLKQEEPMAIKDFFSNDFGTSDFAKNERLLTRYYRNDYKATKNAVINAFKLICVLFKTRIDITFPLSTQG